MGSENKPAIDKDREYSRRFFSELFWCASLLPIIMLIWPDVVPFTFFEFWKMHGTVFAWLYAAWPIFAWGVGVSIILSFFGTPNTREMNRAAEDIIVRGSFRSLVAGVGEEISFRWLLFFGSIVGVTISNFLFFGFLGFGISEWLHITIFGPIVDWMALYGLHAYLFHETGWAVGAAIIATNAFFRDGHKYLGLLGYVNSWFIGLFLFWVMFRFGLPAAIVVHVLYDFLIYLVAYCKAAILRAFGYA